MSDLLILKRGIYHARLDIPVDVRDAFGGRKVLTKSLKTSSKSEANHRKYEFVELWKRQIAQARKSNNKESKESWREEAVYFAETSKKETDGLPSETLKFLELVQKHNIRKIIDRDELIDILTNNSTYTSKTIFTESRLKAYADFQHDRIIQKTIDSQISKIKNLRKWLEEKNAELNFDSIEVYLNSLNLSQKTKKQYIFSFNSFFKWAKKYDKAIREKYKDLANPFENHDLREKLSSEKVERQALSPSDIKLLYEKAEHADLKNLIKIGAYTGMRIEELYKLKVTDIEIDNGISILNISKAKTKAGRRKIPIHSKILELIESYKKESKDDFLFYSAGGNKYNNRSDAMSKRFGRHKTALGFGADFVFHSLRKSTITELHQKGVEPLLITSLVGHKTNTITFDIYSAGPSTKQKKKAIEALDFKI